MLRRAVIERLRNQVPELGARVYQAFLAPVDVGRPYATVKVPTARGSPAITYAGTQPVEVRLYDDRSSYIGLDELEGAVIAALHGAEISDTHEDPPGRYVVQWVPGGGDFVDDERDLIGRLVMFEAAALHEKRGG